MQKVNDNEQNTGLRELFDMKFFQINLGLFFLLLATITFTGCGNGSSPLPDNGSPPPPDSPANGGLNLSGTVSTFVGPSGGKGTSDGIGASARFDTPFGSVTDGTNLYVADSNNHTIRKIVIATGEVTTLAGSAGVFGSSDGTGTSASFYRPTGIAMVGGDLYVSDAENNTIRKLVIATTEVTTLAGTAGVQSSSDGFGSSASFSDPYSITTDGTNLYVGDRFSRTIRQIVISTAEVTTLAGTAGVIGSADGIGAAASFGAPAAITTDGTNLYVADSGNQTIRQVVISTGAVTTLAGSVGLFGPDDGIGSSARFSTPQGITTDGTNLYVSDTFNLTIRQIVISTAAVTTIAGSAGENDSQDGIGAAARFGNPYGISTDGTNLYVSGSQYHTIRQIVLSTAEVTTLAGAAVVAGFVDGNGATARFSYPHGLTNDGTNLYVAGPSNHAIRQISIATSEATTLAGGTVGFADGTGTSAQFHNTSHITTDGTYLYTPELIACTIRQVAISTAEVTTLAGDLGLCSTVDGTGPAANFRNPYGITTDGTNLYVGEVLGNTIRKIVLSTAEVTTLAGTVGGAAGSADGIGAAASFNSPRGLTTDGVNLYVSDSNNHTIRQIVIATGEVTTLAGSAGVAGSSDGIGAAASFNTPNGIGTDGVNLYVSDDSDHTIRQIVIATGEVTTIAGSAGLVESFDGIGSEARFNRPAGITSDGNSLYVVDTNNQNIRKIE